MIFGFWFFILNALADTNRLPVSHFATEGISGWQSKVFKGETQYKITELKGQKFLWALAQGTASGLFLKKKVNIQQMPYLNWSWRVDHLIKGPDEKTKDGDDFPARIYLIISGGITFWNTLALNYVWSNKYPIGEHWPNPFTKNAIMYVVESGSKNLGKVVAYKQNVRETLKSVFKKDFEFIDGIALMTDADNTQTEASAYFGEIYFSSH